MTRLSLIRLYRTEDAPDHIVQEVIDTSTKMMEAILDICSSHDANIILSSLNLLHSSIIIAIVTESGLAEAAKTEAIGLLKNIEHLSKIKIYED